MTVNQYPMTGPIGTTVTKGLVPGSIVVDNHNTFAAGLSQLGSSVRAAASTAATYVITRFPAAAVGKQHSISWQFRLPAASATPVAGTIAALLNTAGNTRLWMAFNAAGAMVLSGQGALVPTAQLLKTPGNANWVPAKDTVYTARMQVSSTAATIRVSDSTDASTVASLTYTFAGALSEDLSSFEVGASSATDGTLVDSGELVITDLTTEAPRFNPGANAAPQVSVGAAQTVQPGATVNLTSTATDSDGTVTGRQWTVSSVLPAGTTTPTITNATSASASVVLPTPGVYVFSHTATDDKGTTGSASTTVYVQHTARTGIPVVDVAAAGWTTQGSPSSLSAAMNDTDTGTSITAPAASSSATFRLCPMTPRTSLTFGLDHIVVNPAAGDTYTVALVDGSTTRKTWTVAPSTAGAVDTLTADSTVCSTIVDWNNVKLTATRTAA